MHDAPIVIKEEGQATNMNKKNGPYRGLIRQTKYVSYMDQLLNGVIT